MVMVMVMAMVMVRITSLNDMVLTEATYDGMRECRMF